MAEVKITTNREIERRLVRIRERIADNLKNRLVCKTLSCLHCYNLGKQDYSVVRSSITSHYKSADHRFFNEENKVQVCLCSKFFWADGPLDDLFFLKHLFDCLLNRPLPLGIQTLIRQAKSIIFVVNSTNKCDKRNSFLDETPFPQSLPKECRPLSEFKLQPFQQQFCELKQNPVYRVHTDHEETLTAAADSCGEREQTSCASGTPVSDGNATFGTAGTSASVDTFYQSKVRDNMTAGDNATTADCVSVANDNAVDNIVNNTAEHCEATTTFENVFEQNEESEIISTGNEITKHAGSKSRLRNSIFFKMLTKVLNKNYFTNLDLLKLNLLKRKYNNERLKQRTLYVEERHVYRHFSRFFCNYVKTKNCKNTILCVLCKPPNEVSVVHFMTHNMHHARLYVNQEMRCCCKCGSYFFMHTESNYCPNYLEHICKCVTGETFLNDEYFLKHFLRRNVVNPETEQLKGELKERTREIETLRAENDLLRYDNEELKREIEARTTSKRDDHILANMLLDMSASGSCRITSTMPISASDRVTPVSSMPRGTREIHTTTDTLLDISARSTSGCSGGCPVGGCASVMPLPSTSAISPLPRETRTNSASPCKSKEVRSEDNTMTNTILQYMSESIPRHHYTTSNTFLDMSVRNEEDHTMANTLLDMSVNGCTSSVPRDIRVGDHEMTNTLLDMSTSGRREMVSASDVTRFEQLDTFNNYAQQTDSYSIAEAPLNYAADYASSPRPPPLTPLMYEGAFEKPERRADVSSEALRHRSFFVPSFRTTGTSQHQAAHTSTPVVRSIQSYQAYLSTKSASSNASSAASKSTSDAFTTLSVLSELLSPTPMSASPPSSSSLSSSMPASLPTGTKRKAEDNQGTKLVKKNK